MDGSLTTLKRLGWQLLDGRPHFTTPLGGRRDVTCDVSSDSSFVMLAAPETEKAPSGERSETEG